MGVKHYIKRVISAVLNRKQGLFSASYENIDTLKEAIVRDNQHEMDEIRVRLEALFAAQEQARQERFLQQHNENMAHMMKMLYRRALADPLQSLQDSGTGKPISVVFISDDGYAVPTGVAITSLLCNKNPDTRYEITVLGRSLSEENVRMLSALSRDVTVMPCDATRVDVYSNTHLYVSDAALLKFDIPQLLPQYDKVLYLDGDILVLGDLTALYETDLGEQYAAVAKDLLGTHFDFHKRTGVSSYFNSGVLLLNTKKMREENTTARLFQNKANDPWNILMDQDTFNVTFAENVVWLHPRYNLMYANNLSSEWTMNRMASFYGVSEQEMIETMKAPVIQHLSSQKKPWNTPLAEKYLDYQEYRILFELLLEREGFSFGKKE